MREREKSNVSKLFVRLRLDVHFVGTLNGIRGCWSLAKVVSSTPPRILNPYDHAAPTQVKPHNVHVHGAGRGAQGPGRSYPGSPT